MVLFLPLLYSFVVIAANSVLKSTRIFHNDISHLCNEIFEFEEIQESVCVCAQPMRDYCNIASHWLGTCTKWCLKFEGIFLFFIISQSCDGTGCWNPSSRKARTYSFCIVNTMWLLMWDKEPEAWINMKMPSYQYRKSHCGDKTILRPSYLHNGISCTGKMPSLYWIRALIRGFILPPLW